MVKGRKAPRDVRHPATIHASTHSPIQPGYTPRVMTDSRSRITRRDALELLGLSAAAAMIPAGASAQAPTFPRGAIIRTLLKDYAPDELAGGATLFHEHMSLGTDFNARFSAATAAARALNGPPPAPLGAPVAPAAAWSRTRWTASPGAGRGAGASRRPQRRIRCPIRS